jgi:hypothetical protein
VLLSTADALKSNLHTETAQGISQTTPWACNLFIVNQTYTAYILARGMDKIVNIEDWEGKSRVILRSQQFEPDHIHS